MRLIASLFGFLLFGQLLAQDSLVYFHELDFNSAFEERSFKNLGNQEAANYFDLFLSIDPQMNESSALAAAQKFDATYSKLNISKVLNKNPARKVKMIYQQVHDDLFDQYLEQNHFSEIFSAGKYNCVSATAIYTIVMHRLGVPYDIKVKPTHVYAVAYPNSEQILVESTDPTGGFIRFSDSYKQGMIDRLANAKLISSNEIKQVNVDDLFSKYYLTDEGVGLKQLAGIQYFNDAIYNIDQGNVEFAHKQAEKAYFLYPEERTKNMLLATCLEYLTNQKYENEESLSYLSQFARFDILDDDFTLSEFSRMINILLIENGQKEKLSNYFNMLIPTIRASDLKLEMSYVYYYEMGRTYYNETDYTTALDFFRQAYELKPSNLDISNILVSTLALSMINTTNYEVIQKMETLKKEYPNLISNNKFKSILLNAYLIQFGMSFDLKSEKEGLKYKGLFEELYDPELTVDQGNVGRSYSICAVYYFRKGYSSKAKTILNEGLNISPHNHELMMRKHMIK